MAAKKTKTKSSDSLREEAAGLIAAERRKKLDSQPLAIAAGGFDKLLDKACEECRGYPNPAEAAARRALQLAGSKPTLDERKGGNEE